VALYEILFMTPHLREMIVKGATSEEIAKAARGEGMRTLYQDGLAKVARGLITMEEVMRVTMGD
jgi:general secretion pathway protein E